MLLSFLLLLFYYWFSGLGIYEQRQYATNPFSAAASLTNHLAKGQSARALYFISSECLFEYFSKNYLLADLVTNQGIGFCSGAKNERPNTTVAKPDYTLSAIPTEIASEEVV